MGGLVLAVAARGRSRTLGAWLAAATGLVLVAFNERAGAFEGLTILALMFTGTMLYRAEQGQIRRGRAAAVAVGIFAAAIVAGAWHLPADGAWLLDVYDAIPLMHGHRPVGLQLALASGFLVALLACCAVTYYLVEAPMQRLGRRVTARLDARFGPDRLDARFRPGRLVAAGAPAS
jgi:peptidoglycan/LPS O-acetylase OafA/YrhL